MTPWIVGSLAVLVVLAVIGILSKDRTDDRNEKFWSQKKPISVSYANQLLRDLELDEPNCELPFSRRLRQKTEWSEEFIQQAIVEYKRFIALYVGAGHLVTPSKVVDEVWHLHLIYTDSYWRKMCQELLEMAVHHIPSRGTSEDDESYRFAYTRTLVSYWKFFGSIPPEPIWGVLPEEVRNEIDLLQKRNVELTAKIRATKRGATASSGCCGGDNFNAIGSGDSCNDSSGASDSGSGCDSGGSDGDGGNCGGGSCGGSCGGGGCGGGD